MVYSVTINTDNAAFADKQLELARILQKLSKTVEYQDIEEDVFLYDFNGNKVGLAQMVGK